MANPIGQRVRAGGACGGGGARGRGSQVGVHHTLLFRVGDALGVAVEGCRDRPRLRGGVGADLCLNDVQRLAHAQRQRLEVVGHAQRGHRHLVEIPREVREEATDDRVGATESTARHDRARGWRARSPARAARAARELVVRASHQRDTVMHVRAERAVQRLHSFDDDDVRGLHADEADARTALNVGQRCVRGLARGEVAQVDQQQLDVKVLKRQVPVGTRRLARIDVLVEAEHGGAANGGSQFTGHVTLAAAAGARDGHDYR
mmetsp:Transcript_9041/g.36976  ORF Transcript_9041/g.36976 Transcript_9041/m.36976 type:complete len:262 (-) Transcript_9041:687-1472(-)